MMRGRGGTRGRGGLGPRGASVPGPPNPLSIKGEAVSRHARYAGSYPMPVRGSRYEASPMQIPKMTAGDSAPFMMPSSNRVRSVPARGPQGYDGHHPGVATHRYGHEQAPESKFGGKAPFVQPPKDMRATRYVNYSMPQMRVAAKADSMKDMSSRFYVPPMMMPPNMRMYSMGRGMGHRGKSGTQGFPRAHSIDSSYDRDRHSPSPRRREGAHASSDDSAKRTTQTLETMVDSQQANARAETASMLLSRLQDGMKRIKFAIPSIFRLRNNLKLKPWEENMIAVVEEVFRHILVIHLQKEQKVNFPLELYRPNAEKIHVKEALIRFVGCKSNLSVMNVTELQSIWDNQPLDYNNGWFAMHWMKPPDAESANVVTDKTLYYFKTFPLNSMGTSERVKRAVFLKGITVEILEEHMDEIIQFCNSGKDSRSAMLQALGYYALWCDDDSFITFASSLLPLLEETLQVQFYAELAKLLDQSRYRIANAFMERYFERILPMCLAVPDKKAWSSTIKLLVKSIEPLRIGLKSSNLVVSLLRTLKSWCNVFVTSEETCFEVFNKCIQLVLQTGDDSRIVVRAAAADLAVHIWLNNKGKAGVINKIGYDTVRTLGCISGVQAIKFNVWSDLLSNDGENDEAMSGQASLSERLLSRIDDYDTVLRYLQHEEASFVTAMLTAEPSLMSYLMNWYLMRYCKITKTLLALEKIASVIRYALMTYPKISRNAPSHASNNIAMLCCWFLNIATSCSVGSGCLELANVKMALFVDWLFFNYEYNSRIIRLFVGPKGTAQCSIVLQRLGEFKRLIIKELAKCVYIMRRPDLVNNEQYARKISVLLGSNEVMSFAYNTDISTFRRLLDYLINAVNHYYSETAVVAIDVVSAIFLVSVLDMSKKEYTFASFLTAIKNTMLGKMCSVLDIALDSIAVHVIDVEMLETKQVLQLKSPLQPINDKYTTVVGIEERHRKPCYDETLKAMMLQCYGMLIEYIINLNSFDAMHHANHLTTDTVRANHEIDLLKQMKCPTLYPNVDNIYVEENNESSVDSDSTLEDISHVRTNVGSVDELSDVSSEEYDSHDDESNTNEGIEHAEGGTREAIVSDASECLADHDNDERNESEAHTETYVDVNDNHDELRKLLQQFVHVSMNNPAIRFTEDPLYIYLRGCLQVDKTSDSTTAAESMDNPSMESKIANYNAATYSAERFQRVTTAVDLVVSYLLETALQWIQDDANGTVNVDSILFKDWIVHIFNAFVRLFVALYLGGHIAIAWELIYYIAAMSISSNKEEKGNELHNPAQKKMLIALTLFFNMVQAVANKTGTIPNMVIQRTLHYVLKKSVRTAGKDLGVIMQHLLPIRFALETVFAKEYQHFWKLSSIMELLMKLSPASVITQMMCCDYLAQFNFFTRDLEEADLFHHIRAILKPCGNNSLHRRYHFIAWQMVCRMYEIAFGNEEMKNEVNDKRSFLQIRSERTVPSNISRLRYITDADIGEDSTENNVLCFLGISNTKRANFMAYQKGYTFQNFHFSNEQAHLLSGAMLEFVRTNQESSMQMAIFSVYPILVHCVPTKRIMEDVTESLLIFFPQINANVAMQFMAEMLLVLIIHWLSRFPQMLEMFATGGAVMREAMDQLALKYAVGRYMIFTFNGTTVKIHLQNIMVLKQSL